MMITKLMEAEKSKIKVYIDEEYAFFLYRKEIIKFDIEEGNDITFDTYQKILQDIVLSRAKQKALAILKFMDRTEFELRKKLSEAAYPENIIERAVSYLYEYHYLDDERFAYSYIRLRKEQKSKLILKTALISKGIDRQIINQVMKDEYTIEEEDPEQIALRKAIAKKTSDPTCLSWEDKQKIIASLYRKGYDIEKIKQYF